MRKLCISCFVLLSLWVNAASLDYREYYRILDKVETELFIGNGERAQELIDSICEKTSFKFDRLGCEIGFKVSYSNDEISKAYKFIKRLGVLGYNMSDFVFWDKEIRPKFDEFKQSEFYKKRKSNLDSLYLEYKKIIDL